MKKLPLLVCTIHMITRICLDLKILRNTKLFSYIYIIYSLKFLKNLTDRILQRLCNMYLSLCSCHFSISLAKNSFEWSRNHFCSGPLTSLLSQNFFPRLASLSGSEQIEIRRGTVWTVRWPFEGRSCLTIKLSFCQESAGFLLIAG